MANEFKVRKGLIVQGSGSIILDIQGSQGELFSVTDSLSGSLFSVNDISGIPIMEVFSDNIIKMGTFNQEAIIVSGSRTGMGIATPQAELHISGANNDSLLRIQSPASASIMFVSGSGNVGLGTLTPTATLEIASTGSATLGQAQIYLNAAAVGRNRIDFNTNGLGVPATTTRSDGTKITLYPAISATNTDIALGVAFPLGVGEFWSSVYNSTISFTWYAAATQIMRLVGDGQLRLGAGTAALPVISAGLSGTDTNTGIYFPTADTIGLVTGGTERARITSAGSASIGTITSTPSATLHVSGANTDNLFRVSSPSAANALFVSGSGNVGIGTTAPSVRLHLSQSSGTFQRVDINNANVDGVNATTEYYTNTGATPDLFGATSFRLQGGTTDAFKQFQVYIANLTSPRFIINGSGNVGINTTSPNARLHISGANNQALLIASSSTAPSALFVSGSGNVGIGTATPTSLLQVAGRVTSTELYVTNGDAIYTTNGSVGIGTSGPTSTNRLQVRGSGATSATTALRVENSAATARLTILDDGTSAFNTNHLYVSGSGRVGIGTTTPIAQLHVTNSMLVNGTSDYFGGIDTTIPIQMFAGVANNGIGFRTDNFYLYPYGSSTRVFWGWNGNAAWNLRNNNTSSFELYNNSPANTVMWTVSSSGNMGVGITSPTARLHVSGASNAGLFEIDSPAVNNIIYVSGSGNVGIGTNLPSADLHISGASADNLLRVGSPTNDNILFVTGSGNIGINTTSSMAFFSGSGGVFGSGEGNIVPTLTIFQSSSATGLNAAGLQIVGSGSSALAAARLNILTMGDKYAYLNIGTSGSGTENNYWEFAKRPSAAVHNLLLSNYSNGVYQSSIMSLSPGANTSTIGSSNQILLEGSTGYIGLQTNTPGTSDWIHLHSKPSDGNYINIDATQTSNSPPLTAATAKTGYGITTNSYFLAEPDYWMEIKLDGVIVLVPCYLPA